MNEATVLTTNTNLKDGHTTPNNAGKNMHLRPHHTETWPHYTLATQTPQHHTTAQHHHTPSGKPEDQPTHQRRDTVPHITRGTKITINTASCTLYSWSVTTHCCSPDDVFPHLPFLLSLSLPLRQVWCDLSAMQVTWGMSKEACLTSLSLASLGISGHSKCTLTFAGIFFFSSSR